MKISDCHYIYSPGAYCWELLDVFTSECGLKAAVGYSIPSLPLRFSINVNQLLEVLPLNHSKYCKRIPNFVRWGQRGNKSPSSSFPDSISVKYFGPNCSYYCMITGTRCSGRDGGRNVKKPPGTLECLLVSAQWKSRYFTPFPLLGYQLFFCQW